MGLSSRRSNPSYRDFKRFAVPAAVLDRLAERVDVPGEVAEHLRALTEQVALYSYPQFNRIVRCVNQILLRAKIPFCRLDGRMTQ